MDGITPAESMRLMVALMESVASIGNLITEARSWPSRATRGETHHIPLLGSRATIERFSVPHLGQNFVVRFLPVPEDSLGLPKGAIKPGEVYDVSFALEEAGQQVIKPTGRGDAATTIGAVMWYMDRLLENPRVRGLVFEAATASQRDLYRLLARSIARQHRPSPWRVVISERHMWFAVGDGSLVDQLVQADPALTPG